jgi:PIN domain nuclease of toxin-antitoxin system
MILLDTHIWTWWVSKPEKLTEKQRKFLESSGQPLAVSIISLWEVSLLDCKGRIHLPKEINSWFEFALEESGIIIIDLSRSIIIDSNNLPGDFQRDPSDRLIVATSRINNYPLLTSDDKILKYPHVLKAID